MATWPTALPQRPLKNSLSVAPEPNVIAFESDAGVEHTRRRATSRRKTIACAFMLTGAQRDLFTTFFEQDLADGTLTYDWRDPVDGVTGTYKIRNHSIVPVGGDAWRLTAEIRRLT